MMVLAINWSNVGLQAGQLLLALSLLVILHEFGHYITARWFKCRVEKFFLFFDPWFALVKKKVGETVYGIGWLPLGGYVKIAGMIDESMDKEAMKQPAQPWEFRSKPAWQRLIVMLGGVIMNVLTAFVIYAFILMVWGEKKTPMSSIKYGIWTTDSLMNEIGLQNGDKIIAVNGDTVRYYEDLNARILLGKTISLERNGVKKEIELPVNLIEKLIESRRKRGLLLAQRIPAYVGKYEKKDTSFGKKAGLQEMDRIVAIDSTPIQFYDEMAAELRKHKNGQVMLTVERKGELIKIASQVSEEGKIGIPYLEDAQYAALGVYQVQKRKFGFFEAFPAGVRKAGEKLQFYIDQFKKILNPKTGAYKGVGGFKAMGSIFPTSWSWEAFWNITAFLSIVLAFMNLLPIPALDGGHVMFTLYEMITKRKPNEKFLEYAQMAGMILLLGLMLYANGNDWFGWGK
ncbi:MAG TPA: RIP metalloprotease RseP [Chitinophagaceae bacterium]|nr:RIP metalloprotease RseP [Chitinophagaceae bacterium]